MARIAGNAIGADGFLPNMGTDEFLSCLSRAALERACANTSVAPRARVKDTRAALVEHFKEERFVYPTALFAPDAAALSQWLTKNSAIDDEDDGTPSDQDELDGDQPIEPAHDFDADEDGFEDADIPEGFREAAE